jgi:hypothetical protein
MFIHDMAWARVRIAEHIGQGGLRCPFRPAMKGPHAGRHLKHSMYRHADQKKRPQAKQRIAGYARTSAHANDIKNQVAMLAPKCGGYVISDKGVSGTTPVPERSSWKELAAAGVKTVLIKNSKRFARSVLVQEQGVAWADSVGIQIIALDRPSTFVDRSRRGVMMRQIEACINEADKGEVVDNLKKGRDAAVLKNGRSGLYTTLTGKGKCSGRKSLLQTHGRRIASTIRTLIKKPYPKRRSKRSNTVMSWSQLANALATRGFRPRSHTKQHPKLLARSAIQHLLQDLQGRRL